MMYHITTLPGLEPILEEELNELGFEVQQKGRQVISCLGTEESIYRLNLSLRTGLRVLWEIRQVPIQTVQELYREAKALPWEKYIFPHQTIAVSVSSTGSSCASLRYLTLVLKDAVVDRFSEIYGKRPSVDTRSPDLPIHLHLEGHTATFSLDTSGESLHRRGYRTERTEAPLSEVLAAGILKVIGWHPEVPLYDPMCGSGTFLVEAGLMAYRIAPGILRTRFAFQNWKVFHKALYEKVRKELAEPYKNLVEEKNVSPKDHRGQGDHAGEKECAIFGSDKDPAAIEIARRNLERAGLGSKVRVFLGTFESLLPPFPPSRGGLVIVNPPYGKRLEDPSILALYKSIGDTLKQRYPGVEAWILSANPDALKQIGLRPFKKYALKNGPLDCKLVGFTLYNGSIRTR